MSEKELKDFDAMSKRHIQNQQDFEDQQVRNGCRTMVGCAGWMLLIAIIFTIILIIL